MPDSIEISGGDFLYLFMRENPGSHSHSLSVYGFNCTQLNIAPRADRFELYAGLESSQAYPVTEGLVRLHCMLHLLNRLTVILLLKGLAPETSDILLPAALSLQTPRELRPHIPEPVLHPVHTPKFRACGNHRAATGIPVHH